jgi:hypothetical protein
MDEELFKQKLSEVAEWQIPDIKLDSNDKRKLQNKRGRPTNEEQYQEEHEQEFINLFEGKNPTAAPELVGLKKEKTLCADCGNLCNSTQRREIKYYKNQRHHIDHVRIKCIECNMYRHPETGVFNLPAGPACQVFLNWSKKQYSIRIKLDKKVKDK